MVCSGSRKCCPKTYAPRGFHAARPHAFNSADYIFEIKFDGFRALAFIEMASADIVGAAKLRVALSEAVATCLAQRNRRCVLVRMKPMTLMTQMTVLPISLSVEGDWMGKGVENQRHHRH